jgi:hypothetical protein
VQKGHFVGYDSQSKGYRIYWPNKRSISVERDVTFNPDDIHLQSEESVVIFGDVLHEGEKDKIIQPNDMITSNKNQHDSNEDIPHDETETYSETSSQSTPKPRRSHDVLPEPEPNTGWGMHARLPPGAYRALAKGTNDTAATTYIPAFSCDTELDDEGLDQGGENNVDKEVMIL